MTSNMVTITETLTPEIAKEYLSLNIETNRKLITSNILKIKSDMENGNFELTHQGIAFDTDGYLCDGQNRMKALSLCKPGTKVQMQVSRNVPKKAFYVIDGNAPRSERFRMQQLINESEYYSTLGMALTNGLLELYKLYPSNFSVEQKKDFVDAHKGLHYVFYKIATRNIHTIGSIAYIKALICAYACGEKLKVIEAFDNCANRAVIDSSMAVNWKAPMDLFQWYTKLDSSGGQGGRNAIQMQTEKQIYLFSNNAKKTTKTVFYEPTSLQLEQANTTLENIMYKNY